MKIYVLLREVQDGIINKNSRNNEVKIKLNPYDQHALEEAIRQKEKHDGKITIIRINPEKDLFTKEALALGADEAVLITSENKELDDVAISKVLAHYFEEVQADLILLGSDTNDRGSDVTGLRLSELLGIVGIGAAQKITIEQNRAAIERFTDTGTELVEATLPLVITCEDVINDLRYPQMQAIMSANEKPVQTISVRKLHINEQELLPKTKVTEIIPRNIERNTKVFTGSAKEQVAQLGQSLREDKVL